MGNGKKKKCNDCGAEWYLLYGEGLLGETPTSETKPDVCPECGSTNIDDVPNIEVLWD